VDETELLEATMNQVAPNQSGKPADKIVRTMRQVERYPCLLCGGRPYLAGMAL
jgi:hypothetical protein